MYDEGYEPGTPNFSSHQEIHLLDWEEHTVIPFQIPKYAHDRVTRYRQGEYEKKVKEEVQDHFESRLYFQSEQRKLATLINEVHHVSLLGSLRGDGCSSEENNNNNNEVVVDNFIKSVLCANETQKRVLKLSDEIRSLKKQVEALEAIKCGVKEENKDLEIKVMKAENFECSLRRELPLKEARLKEVNSRNFYVHESLINFILHEGSEQKRTIDTFRETYDYLEMLCSFYNEGVEAAIDDITKKHPGSDLGALIASSRKSLVMNPDQITLQPWYYELEASVGPLKNQAAAAAAAAVEDVAGDEKSHIEIVQEAPLKNQAPKETFEGKNSTEPEISIDVDISHIQRDQDLQQQSKKRTREKEEEELEQYTKKARSGNGQVSVFECLETADPYEKKHSPATCLAKVEKYWQKINAGAIGWSDKYLANKLMGHAILNEEMAKREDLERIPILVDSKRALHEKVEDLQATVVRFEEVNKGLRFRLNKAKEFIAVLKTKFIQVEQDVDKIICDTKKIEQELEDFTDAYNERVLVMTCNMAKSTVSKKIAELLHRKGFQATTDAVATNTNSELDLCGHENEHRVVFVQYAEPSSETDTKTGQFLEKC